MCLVLLALRPIDAIESGVDWLTSPLRWLAEPTRPLVWASGRSVSAEEAIDQDRVTENSAEIDELSSELLQLAAPTRADLTAGRDLVPAEVIGRADRDPDRLRVRVTDTTALIPGLPVVYGNTYVGRVQAVDEARLEVAIDLVTGPRFAVGAQLADRSESQAIWMTVGGVVSARGARPSSVERLALVVRNPSDREAPAGPLVVGELLPGIDPYAYLAEGYGLGTLAPLEPRKDRMLFADIDYGAGLFHVYILCPGGDRRGAKNNLDLAVSDSSWRPTNRISAGDPSSWRGGMKLAAGRSAQVETGAALISGLQLIGRVERAGSWSSDVRRLADPGLTLVAVARIEDSPLPRVLGRLISLGIDEDEDWIRFRWEAVLADEEQLSGSLQPIIEARLFTGSGLNGLPAGLFIGEALLSPNIDPVVGAPLVLVRRDLTPDLSNLWVRTAKEFAQ
ncbi:MAG: hypothetical protein ACI8TQ_003065 [Planctomycetota bacterium]|jgi:hypothetical protein